ncbi:low-density lipoprotein receptor-related protein 4-like [Strongylocentrotus purpuratus]|uniref:EGF-like domain-containing protein n=1 Tax=Strongylocentrotus purpuratus TaxID=7668 RepID=A0A7M7P3T8_STRPU|nr:low-density lipoprotein receptor-related protein 4-like [Strongylocentrotus purpuratus]
MLNECNEIMLPNGSMVQTIPKLAVSPEVAAFVDGKSLPCSGTEQRVCKYPDCYSNPCENGWCEETMQGYHCHCSTGFQGHNCDEDLPATRRDETALLTPETTISAISSLTSTSDPSTTIMTSEPFVKIFVADSGAHKIFVADLKEELVFTSIPSTMNPEFLEYDSKMKKLYWNDVVANRIYRANVDGSNREVVTFASNEASAGVAIAKNTGMLFVAYPMLNKITSMSIAPGSPIPGIEVYFGSQSVREPRVLEADEEKGYLYWTMSGKVARKLLSGSGDTEIIYKSMDSEEQFGFSIDIIRKLRRIFFYSLTTNKVFYKDVDIPHNTSFAQEVIHDYWQRPNLQLRSLSYFNEVLVWIARYNNTGVIGIAIGYDDDNGWLEIKEVDQFMTPSGTQIILP